MRRVASSVSQGITYSVVFFAVEIGATAALTIWLGVDTTLFQLVRRELFVLLLQYAALCACLGLLLHPLLRRLQPPVWMQRFLGRRGLAYGLLTLTFSGLTYVWNAEPVLPRVLYVQQACTASVLIALFLAARVGLRRLSGWLTAHTRAWVPRAAAAMIVLAVVGTAVYRLLPGRSTGGSPSVVSQRTGDRAPNVLVIVIDTVRHDHLSTYGYERPTSPKIDRIASTGVVYERAFSTAGWTLPAHASLFTGLYPSTHLVDSGQTRLDAALPTLAAALRAGGYRTASFVANAWVTAATGLDRGFDRVEFFGASGLIGSSFVSLAIERLRTVLNLDRAPDVGGRELTARMSEWIRESNASGQPFFAFANYMEVHEPYGTVPEPYFRSYLDQPVSPTIGRRWLRDAPLFTCSPCSSRAAAAAGAEGLTCENDRWQVSAERRNAVIALYDAGIRFVDDQIGALDDVLEELGIDDDTLVVVTSDHGESLGEHDFFGHGVLYNQVLQIPLIVRYPKALEAGARVDIPVSLIDIFPTVLEVARLPLVQGLQGTSIRNLEALAGRPARVYGHHAAIPEHVWQAAGKRLGCDYHRAGLRNLSLQTTSAKYIWSSDGQAELYDVIADPGETQNLAESSRDGAALLEQALFSWLAWAEAAADDRTVVPVDPATRRRLESLGYIR